MINYENKENVWFICPKTLSLAFGKIRCSTDFYQEPDSIINIILFVLYRCYNDSIFSKELVDKLYYEYICGEFNSAGETSLMPESFDGYYIEGYEYPVPEFFIHRRREDIESIVSKVHKIVEIVPPFQDENVIHDWTGFDSYNTKKLLKDFK